MYVDIVDWLLISLSEDMHTVTCSGLSILCVSHFNCRTAAKEPWVHQVLAHPCFLCHVVPTPLAHPYLWAQVLIQLHWLLVCYHAKPLIDVSTYTLPPCKNWLALSDYQSGISTPMSESESTGNGASTRQCACVLWTVTWLRTIWYKWPKRVLRCGWVYITSSLFF